MPENSTNNPEVRSEQVQEILTKVPHWLVSSGNTLLLLFILLIVLISWFVKYPDVIEAPVMLTSVNPPEKIYARAGGSLEAMLINDGDQVAAGQPLAVLESAARYEDVLKLSTAIDTLKVNRSFFWFPLDQMPILILGELNNSYANFENSYLEYLLNRQDEPLVNEANVISLNEARKRLQNLLDQQALSERELELKLVDLEREKTQYDNGYISRQSYENKEIEIIQARKGVKNLESSISQAREQINNAEKELKSTSIRQSQTGIKLLRKTLQAFYQLKKDIDDWERNYLMRASIDGYVSLLNVWHQNQSVNSGDLVFTIIPLSNQGFIGKIEAPSANSAKIKPGQKVQIKLANYPAEEFGELVGNIQSISLVPDEQDQYLVNVNLPEELVTSYNKTLDFRQEMKGQADIVTEDLRLMDRFFYQLRGILQ